MLILSAVAPKAILVAEESITTVAEAKEELPAHKSVALRYHPAIVLVAPKEAISAGVEE